jgi:predicted TPR repeat methyltransferase
MVSRADGPAHYSMVEGRWGTRLPPSMAGRRGGGLICVRFQHPFQRFQPVGLGKGLRYAHSAGYTRAAVAAAGLALSRLEEPSARHEDNVPVPGLVAVATKP